MRSPLFATGHQYFNTNSSLSMLELHVWGSDSRISVINPECLACAWLLSIHLVPQEIPFRIVTSCNTNLADSGRLPLLVKKNSLKKYEGFGDIAYYISKEYPTDSTKFVPDEKLPARDQLVNLSLLSYFSTTMNYINQYNLYVNSQNYECYTRKLFLSYFPFPMMYNQPLKFHAAACEQVKVVGLGINKVGMFSITGAADDVAETELVNDDSDDEVAISALHEKMLISKSKSKSSLRESRNSLKCLHLLNKYISHIQRLFEELNPNSPVEFAHLFRSKKVSSSELLLYSYFYSLTYELPDPFVANYLKLKFPAFWKFASTITEALNSGLARDNFRAPQGPEIPNLWNEVALTVGLLKY